MSFFFSVECGAQVWKGYNGNDTMDGYTDMKAAVQ